MSDTLTQLTSKLQTLLGDNGAIFPTTTCTAAIRQALAEFNLRAPQLLSLTLPGTHNQYTYDLSSSAPTALKILDVLLQGQDSNQLHTSLTYDDYTENEHLFLRLRQPVTTGETLIVRYTAPHTITGLDGSTSSTLPAHADQVLLNGAAYWAIHTRAIARIEQVNMSPDLSEKYAQAMTAFRSAFDLGLAEAAHRPAPVSEPDPRAWNDSYHNWGQ